MKNIKQQKEALVTGIVLRLSKSYTKYSSTHQVVREALLKKLSLNELDCLYAMVLTSTDKD